MANRCRIFLFICAALLAGAGGCQPAPIVEPPGPSSEFLTPQDRILILAPHPDDEILGCGGVIQKAVAMGLPLKILFLTYGDNNEWAFLFYRKHPVLMPRAVRKMGLVRREEAVAAAKLLGVAEDQLIFLGYPDYGTLGIWIAHWGAQPPLRSTLTRVNEVPYENALRPGAPYKGEEVVRDLTGVFREFKPTKVFFSHPADVHPDHRALYLFTRVALWDMESEMKPELYLYLIHFRQWPKPQGNHPSRPLESPALLKDQIPWQTLPLDSEEVARKREALKVHRSQFQSSASYLLSFVRANELFGDFPPAVFLEEITDEEQAAFVGIERRFVRLEKDHLILSIEFSRPLAKVVTASVFLFGYRSDRPFPEMPKLRVEVGEFTHRVFDQKRRLPSQILEVTQESKRITLRIPLRVLGDPERILASVRTYLGKVPLDWASWRILELNPKRRG